jgi:UDP-glucuronate 4-epimerase
MRKNIILVTGCAGFIGFHTCKYLLKNTNSFLVGVDNMNKYYDFNLKKNRLSELNINKKFKYFKIDISNFNKLEKLFKQHKFSKVINLAAQAGVRYSLKNTNTYLKSNIIGFYNLLELSKKHKIKHFLFASSSSVYGNNKIPHKESDSTDKPLSFYAATKKTNEILSYPYAYLYNLKITGIRFFTVYGPYGRPDMALYKFVDNLLNKKNIELYNFGEHIRDFTYIDDVTKGISKILNKPPKGNTPFEIINIGRGKPEHLNSFLDKILSELGIAKPNIVNKKIQSGDVLSTFASTNKLFKMYKFKPSIDIEIGIKKFVQWYREYYKK